VGSLICVCVCSLNLPIFVEPIEVDQMLSVSLYMLSKSRNIAWNRKARKTIESTIIVRKRKENSKENQRVSREEVRRGKHKTKRNQK
jgi:hypothetical protein